MGELFNLTCLLEGPLASLVNQDSVVEADGLLILPHERGHHRFLWFPHDSSSLRPPKALKSLRSYPHPCQHVRVLGVPGPARPWCFLLPTGPDPGWLGHVLGFIPACQP